MSEARASLPRHLSISRHPAAVGLNPALSTFGSPQETIPVNQRKRNTERQKPRACIWEESKSKSSRSASQRLSSPARLACATVIGKSSLASPRFFFCARVFDFQGFSPQRVAFACLACRACISRAYPCTSPVSSTFPTHARSFCILFPCFVSRAPSPTPGEWDGQMSCIFNLASRDGDFIGRFIS